MNILNKFRKLGRVLATAFVLAGATLGTGCIEADPPAIDLNDYLEVVGSDYKEIPLRVMSNTDWVATGYPDWIQLLGGDDRGHGTKDITVHVMPFAEDTANPNGRQGTITFRTQGSNSQMAVFTVNQSSYAAELEVYPENYTISAPGGDVYFMVVSNADWVITGADGYDWITSVTIQGESAGVYNGTGIKVVTLEVAPNPKHGTPRTAHLSISNNSVQNKIVKFFDLTQTGLAPAEIILGQSEVNFPAVIPATPVPTHKVPIITNMDITDEPVIDVSAPIWCGADVEKEGDVWYVYITPQTNQTSDPRECVITVTVPNVDDEGNFVMAQIKVTQDAADSPYLEVLSPIVTIPANDFVTNTTTGNVSDIVAYISNENVQVLDWPSWFYSADPAPNTGKPVVTPGTSPAGTVTFTALPNLDPTPRQGTIELMVSARGINVIRTITVIQQGLGEFTVTVTPSAANLPAGDDGQTPDNELEFRVYAHSTITGLAAPTATNIVQLDGSWIRATNIDVATGLSSGSAFNITFEADPNDHHSLRVGTVDIFWTHGTQTFVSTINLTQQGVGGPQITVMPTFITVPNEVPAGADPSAALAVLNADELESLTCDVVNPAGWVTGTWNATDSEIELFVTAENTAEDARTATMFVVATQGGDQQIVEVTIMQPGKGAAEIDIPKNIYYIDHTAQEFDIAAKALNGTIVPTLSMDYDPVAMFVNASNTPTAPVLNDDNALTKITVNIGKNEASKPRTGEIILLAENGDQHQFYIITIVQEGNVPINARLVANRLNAQWDAGLVGEKLMLLNLPVDTTDAEIAVTMTAGWIELAAATPVVVDTPNKTATIEFEVTENNPKTKERTAEGVITVTRSGETQDIPFTVVQEAAPGPQVMSPTSEVIFLAADAANDTRTVTFYNMNDATVTYNAYSSDESFVTATVAANGVLTVTLIPGANETLVERTAVVTVTAKAADVTSTITVNVRQLALGAPELVLGTNSMFFSSAAHTNQVLHFANLNGAVVTHTKPAWITDVSTLTQGTLDGAGLYTFNVEANPSTEDRTGEIVLVASQGGQTIHYQIGVVQSGKAPMNLQVAPAGLLAGPAATTIPHLVSLKGMPADAEATITSLDTWVDLSSDPLTIAGTGTAKTFEIDVEENTTGYPRAGTVLVEVIRNMGTPGNDEVQRFTVSVLQMAKALVMPTASVHPTSLVFEAVGATAQTVTVYSTDAEYVHTVSAPAWITPVTVAAPATDTYTTTFDVEPAGDNLTATPLTGEIVLLVENGSKTQVITIPVAQKAALTPIYPTTYSVVFPAEAFGAAGAMPVELVGFNDTDYTFVKVVHGTWFSVDDPPTNTVETLITPITANAGPSARTGKVDITILSNSDPNYKAQFTIDVTQEAPGGANIGYGPSYHSVGVGGTIEPLDMLGNPVPTVDIENYQVRTLFANPDGLTLEVTSGLDPKFVSAVDWEDPTTLKLVVQTNAASMNARSTVINVVAKNAGGVIVGTYPIRVTQSGVAEPAPDAVATFINSSVVFNDLQHPVNYAVTAPMEFQSDVEIIGVEIVEPAVVPSPFWLTALAYTNDPGNTPPGFVTYTITEGPGNGYPTVAGASASARIKATVRRGVLEYEIYHSVTVIAPELPAIGATLTADTGSILAGEPTEVITFLDDMGDVGGGVASDSGYPATIQAVTAANVQYPAGTPDGAWLSGATFTIGGTSPASTITVANIPANTGSTPRTANIVITLTADHHKDQQIVYQLTQAAAPLIGGVFTPADATITAIETNPVVIAVTSPNGVPVVGASPVIAYTPNTIQWLGSATFDVSTPGQITITGFDPNPTAAERSADITFTLNLTANDALGNPTQYQPQELTFRLTQEGLEEIGATYPSPFNGSILFSDTTAPIAFTNVPAGTTAVITDVEYVNDPLNAASWLAGVSGAFGVGPDANNFTVTGIAANDDPLNSVERSAIITLTLSKPGCVDQVVTYTLTQGAMPAIGATLTASYGEIGPEVASAPITFSALNGADVASYTVQHIDGGNWLNGTIGSLSSNTYTIGGIPANESTVDRHAIITLTLALTGYQNETISYTLTQRGYEPATYNASYVQRNTAATTLVVQPGSNPDGLVIKSGSILVNDDVDATWATGTAPAVGGTGNDELTFTFDAAGTKPSGSAPNHATVTFDMVNSAGTTIQTVTTAIVQMPVTDTDLLTIGTAPVLGWQASSTGAITFTDNAGTPTTVTVYNSTPGITVGAVGAGSIPVTAPATRNATGYDDTYRVLLRAVNGTKVEYYEVDVTRSTLTTSDLYDLFTFTGSSGINGTQTGSSTAAFTVSMPGVGPQEAYIGVTPDTNVSDYKDSPNSVVFVEIDDNPDNFWNAGEVGGLPIVNRGPSWDGTNNRMVLNRRGSGNGGSGTSNFRFTVTIDQVVADFTMAITR